jgi:hypothetical protein
LFTTITSGSYKIFNASLPFKIIKTICFFLEIIFTFIYDEKFLNFIKIKTSAAEISPMLALFSCDLLHKLPLQHKTSEDTPLSDTLDDGH